MADEPVKRVPSANLSDGESNDGVAYLDGEPFTGVSFSTHAGGELRYETTWRHGVEWGPQRLYAADGQLLKAGEYRAGFREGVWRSWHPDGRPASEEECEFGCALSRRRWDAAGTLVEDYRLSDGDPAFATLQMYRQAYGRSGYIGQPVPAEQDAEPGAAADGGGM